MKTNSKKIIRIMSKRILNYDLYILILFLIPRLWRIEFNIFKEFYPGDYFLLLLPLVVSIIGLISAPFLRRVLYYWILDLMGFVIPIIVIYIMFFIHTLKIENGNPAILFVGFYIVLLLIILWAGVNQQEDALNRATPYNIESGALDIKKALWDITKPVYFDTPETLERARKKGFAWYIRLSAIASGIGLYLGRNKIFSNEDFLALGMYLLMVVGMTYGSTPKVNLILQTIRWEREIGEKIQIKPIK